MITEEVVWALVFGSATCGGLLIMLVYEVRRFARSRAERRRATARPSLPCEHLSNTYRVDGVPADFLLTFEPADLEYHIICRSCGFDRVGSRMRVQAVILGHTKALS